MIDDVEKFNNTFGLEKNILKMMQYYEMMLATVFTMSTRMPNTLYPISSQEIDILNATSQVLMYLYPIHC